MVTMKQIHKEIAKKIRRRLAETAAQTVEYVALGEVMKRDLAAQHAMSEKDIARLLREECQSLAREIRDLSYPEPTKDSLHPEGF